MDKFSVLQRATTMTNRYETLRPFSKTDVSGKPGQSVAPAEGGYRCRASEGACTCNDAGGLSGFAYAIGTIEAEYPNVAIEREMQALAHHYGVDFEPDRDLSRSPTEDRHWQYAVLSGKESENRNLTRYIARQLRWRLTIEDFPIFVLSPGDPNILDNFIDALNRPKYFEPKAERRRGKRGAETRSDATERSAAYVEDLDVIVGVVGPQTSDGNTVIVDQTFPIPRERLGPPGFSYFSQLADNPGLSDEDRAYNFLAARYTPPPLSHGPEFDLSRVRIMPSRLGAATADRIVRAIYTFRNAEMAEKEYFVRVDVTHEFPMIVSPMQPYVERGE
ncbi:cyanobactin maturation protease PatG family protein [Methylorubrum extorquens]